ncbi:hypothetical protein [Rhodococcus sp. AW25M09]|uniref:hypothetical protein n=1 Tax=Rhodococcus sp. AW25M09 TaxID=1268303 RepID=UPI0012F94E82|nr:hypothetical protein [Rhodococcus sp. AW25M09]
MMVLGTGTAALSPPVHFVWKTLMRPDLHPHNRGFSWPVMFEDQPVPRVVESSEFDRVVWSSPWSTVPDILLQFDLRPTTDLRWTLSAHAPLPSLQTIEWLRGQVRHLVNVDLRNALGH